MSSKKIQEGFFLIQETDIDSDFIRKYFNSNNQFYKLSKELPLISYRRIEF